MKKTTRFIALALSMALFVLAFTGCGPNLLTDAGGSQALVEALRAAGYSEDELEKLCRENWLRLLKTVWREA